MKSNKLLYVSIIFVFVVCFVSICFSLKNIFSKVGEKDINDDSASDKVQDVISKLDNKENINEFVDYVKTYEINNRSDYANQYNLYYIYSGVLNGYNYSTVTGEFLSNLNYVFDGEKGFYSGKIFTKDDGSIYFSIDNTKKCFVKPFESEEIEEYDISETTKCHKLYILGDKLNADLFVYNSVTGLSYNEGDISDSPLNISVFANLLDIDAATYKWYRNGVLVEDNFSSSLTVENDEEAIYYVEVTAIDGTTVQSKPVTVKIKK